MLHWVMCLLIFLLKASYGLLAQEIPPTSGLRETREANHLASQGIYKRKGSGSE